MRRENIDDRCDLHPRATGCGLVLPHTPHLSHLFQMSQATLSKCYVFTLNNPTCPIQVPTNVAYLTYQEETGVNGTPHYQGYVEFSKQTRITSIKKLGPQWQAMHLEKRRGTQAEAIAYANKLETRTGKIVTYGMLARSGVSRPYDRFVQAINDGEPIDTPEYTDQYLRHKRNADEIIRDRKKVKREDIQVPDIILHDWQQSILDLLSKEPDMRKIHWYWDSIGGTGKSTFTKYLIKFHHALAISTTSKERVIRAYQGEPVVVLDITRQEGNKGEVNYSTLETMKDGYGFNTMYEPGLKIWRVPHVIVFSNIEPDYEQLSADRWHVTNLNPPVEQQETDPAFISD